MTLTTTKAIKAELQAKIRKTGVRETARLTHQSPMKVSRISRGWNTQWSYLQDIEHLIEAFGGKLAVTLPP